MRLLLLILFSSSSSSIALLVLLVLLRRRGDDDVNALVLFPSMISTISMTKDDARFRVNETNALPRRKKTTHRACFMRVTYISRTSRRGVPFKKREESTQMRNFFLLLECCSVALKTSFFKIDQFIILLSIKLNSYCFSNSGIDERDLPTTIHRGLLLESENTNFAGITAL